MDFKFLNRGACSFLSVPTYDAIWQTKKNLYTQPTHTHKVEKKIPETDAQWNEKKKKSRQNNVSCNDFEKKKFCHYTLFSLEVSIPPKYYTICSTLSMMKHKYPPGQLMFLNRLN